MPCPPVITQVNGTTAVPAHPGAPVTVLVPAGAPGASFGGGGDVLLQCGTAAPITVDPATVAWTAAVVSFVLPASLQPCGSGKWKLFLRPAGDTALCPPTGLELNIVFPPVVAVDPVLAAVVPNVISSETAFAAVGLEFGSAPRVLAPGLEGMFEWLLEGQVNGETYASAWMATVYALQQSDAYDRNQLRMDLDLVVRNTTTNRTSNSKTVTVVIPPPRPGVASVDGTTLYFGKVLDAQGNPRFPARDDAQWLGQAAAVRASDGQTIGGSVTVYRTDPTAQILPHLPAPNVLDAVLGGQATANLSAVRRAADHTLTIQYWHEEGIAATLPAGVTQGFAVVWRDDIPSAAQPFVRIPAPPCTADALLPQLRQLYDLSGTPAEGLTLPAGAELVSAVPQRGSLDSNELGLALGMNPPGATVDVGFRLLKNGQPAASDQYSLLSPVALSNAGFTPATGQLRALLRPPAVTSHEDPVGPDTWQLEIVARVTIPACPGGPIEVSLKTIGIRQLPLEVPTVVLACLNRDPHHSGDYLVILPMNTRLSLAGAAASTLRATSLASNAQVTALAGILRGIITAARLLARFSGLPIPQAGHLDYFDYILNRLSGAPGVSIDASGEISNLQSAKRTGNNWNDDIRGVAMIGAPKAARCTFWPDFTFTGSLPLPLAVPNGTILGSYWTLWSLYTDTVGLLDLAPGQTVAWTGGYMYASASSFKIADAKRVP